MNVNAVSMETGEQYFSPETVEHLQYEYEQASNTSLQRRSSIFSTSTPEPAVTAEAPGVQIAEKNALGAREVDGAHDDVLDARINVGLHPFRDLLQGVRLSPVPGR